jgi:thiol-disulfide isomerase/thioredoxin
VACGVAIVVILLALIEHFGNAFMSRRILIKDAETESPAVSSPISLGVMSLHDSPQTIPNIRFKDASGHDLSLENFRAKVVLLNIWATWCVPCRQEMPTLDRLQDKLGGPNFQVIPLSIDRGGIEEVAKFYTEVGVKHLGMYIDSSSKAARDLDTVGLPTTLLLDRKGREIGRLIGPVEWDTPEMIALLQSRISSTTTKE